MNDTLTTEQHNELSRLKDYFPFRIVFGVLNKDSGDFATYAKTTMHTANRLARQGHKVFILKSR